MISYHTGDSPQGFEMPLMNANVKKPAVEKNLNNR